MFFKEVRELTKDQHDSVEQLIGSHFLDRFSLPDYHRLVMTNFLFHSFLEEEVVANTLDTEQKNKIIWGERKKSSALRQDLQKLNLWQQAKEVQKQINQKPTVASKDDLEIYGWVYVGEGSMLGGKYIHKILSQNPEVSGAEAFNFYELYQEKTGRLWKVFKEKVKEHFKEEEKKKQFLKGVKEAYSFFEKCIELSQMKLASESVFKSR